MAVSINFPLDAPKLNLRRNRIEFVAEVDGERVLCAVTQSALLSKFHGMGRRPLDVFHENRERIDAVATEWLRKGSPDCDFTLVLTADHF